MSKNASFTQARSLTDDVSFQRLLQNVSYSADDLAQPPGFDAGREAGADKANFDMATDVLDDVSDGGPPAERRCE